MFSDGTVEAGSITFPLCLAVIDACVTVIEAEIAAAMRWIVEGAADVAMAGMVKTAEVYRGGKVAVVLCGRNISFKRFQAEMDSPLGWHPIYASSSSLFCE